MLSGWCLSVFKGIIVSKKVRKSQLVLYHATTAFSSSAFQYCLSGWCLGVVWMVSGCCQRGNCAITSEKSSTGPI